ncbi:MAG: CGNR zinc finger domain-containing protein [Alphaproteobacteria bacterium]|nr:CGNR zinc finger domain-containing protein [Alphaproteobacteria bacterium]
MAKAEPVTPPPALLRAERADLCLEFADTRFWRGTPAPTETLKVPADLLAWCGANAALDAASLRAVEAQWKDAPPRAAAAFAEALSLRETIFAIFSATAQGMAPRADELAAFNQALDRAPRRAMLAPAADGYAWQVAPPRNAPSLLAAVLWSGGDLLAGPRRLRVRQCANPQCQWLFLDDSKSGTRRWCSMSACGNRAKAHRHYLRVKGGG